MANADAPFGLKPVRYISGAPYNGAANVYRVTSATSNLMVGDPVYDGGWGVNSDGVPIVDIATIDETTTANGSDIVGVVVGIVADDNGSVDRDTARFISASGAGYVLVADDPDLLFEVQADAALTVADADNFYALNYTAGNTVNGLSKTELDVSAASASAGAGYVLRPLSLARKADNTAGANGVWEVQIVRHQRRAVVPAT